MGGRVNGRPFCDSVSLVREIGLLERLRKGALAIKFKEMDCT